MPAPKTVSNQNLITKLFQIYVRDKDIRTFKRNFFYYFYYRFSRLFLNAPIKIKINNLKLYSNHQKNKTSHSLIQKCDFFDVSEINMIKKLNNYHKIFMVDCGCNFGFYSLFTASLSKDNRIISIEASRDTLEEFNKNLTINNFNNIKVMNKAVMDIDNKKLFFNESEKDWESSLVSDKFIVKKKIEIETVTIDKILMSENFDKKLLILKIDVEGTDFNVLEGAKNTIKINKPIIIIEFSKYIFKNKKFNYQYLNNFLKTNNYQIFGKKGEKHSISEILSLLANLDKAHDTIGNYYLLSNNREEISKKIFN